MSSDRVHITIYECFTSMYHRVVKEKQITKSKWKLIKTCCKVLELVIQDNNYDRQKPARILSFTGRKLII